MTDYEKLIKALRCKRDDCEGCDIAFFDKDEGWMCRYAAKDDDAADAIEELLAEVDELKQHHTNLLNMKEMTKEEENEILEYIRTIPIGPLEPMLIEQLPKYGKWIWDNKRCIYVCSVCGSPKVRENMDRQIIKEQAYCYSCGAKMEMLE